MNKKYIRLFGAGHLITDIYQGALPAMLPFLISEKHFSYATAAFLIFAANASSSIIQPVFGVYADKISLPWALGVGVLLGGIGLGLVGIVQNYYLIILLVALSGIGLALFHPEGARLTNRFAGENKTSAVSIFAAGGNIGFAVGPILTTTMVLALGLKGTLILCIPAVVMGGILLYESKNFSNEASSDKELDNIDKKEEVDEWGAFGRLTLTLLCRSTVFFGLNTFLTLYYMNILKQSEVQGSIALSTLIVVGAVGTLFAGKLSSKIGNKKLIIIGYSCLLPLLILFLNIKNPILATIILIPLGFFLYMPYSPMVALGQKYLPNHLGLASGITLGLGVTMGGLVSPILGYVSDTHGIHAALSCLIVMPIIAVVLARKLPVKEADLKNNASQVVSEN
ncbi:MFS transporter [Clostridium neonatale]|uniref:MFS transporter n=1 Tax=Clostridium neonatale TaxID=137838 RepID=UPI00291BD4EB|nr:MFS transporter [Clostridium neonatale]CAI3577955.1 putative MFS-type transporter [Clostridium neonatale]CAI3644867.1 putative MFS-type transporter [Clostridium neonatale]CAI3652450.1 putative MFS-type transporter [Clostridium neonatale]CAI3656881.1 putative MFS-type transporter [Clostridium neonatale]CAI3657722.1 putative MFS-type transporter [Clostridium neonatale]